jgi:shikimate kinase
MSEPKILFCGKPSLSLTGFMFSGKSSVGRSLARRLGLEYVDLDNRIVERAGKSIEQIFREDGEADFRRIEREVVAEVLPVPGRVVAAGGGAIIDPENRGILRANSCVIWLKASPEAVLARLRASRGRVRPLLEVEDPEAEVRRLIEARREYYEQCDLTMDTDGLGVRAVARKIIETFELGPRGGQRQGARAAARRRPVADNRHGGCECKEMLKK